jgi:hypothetical protein
MSMSISPERAAKRALITGYLARHGRAPSCAIYRDIPEIGDSTETSRLINAMRRDGEISSEEIEPTDEQRKMWGVRPGTNNTIKIHRLVNRETATIADSWRKPIIEEDDEAEEEDLPTPTDLCSLEINITRLENSREKSTDDPISAPPEEEEETEEEDEISPVIPAIFSISSTGILEITDIFGSCARLPAEDVQTLFDFLKKTAPVFSK